jgi:hypothetical protein
MMRRLKLIVAMGAVFMLAGCFDSTPKLSQEEEKLLEAVTYLFTGLEDNLDDTDAKGMPWQRTVKPKTRAAGLLTRRIGSRSQFTWNAIRWTNQATLIGPGKSCDPCWRQGFESCRTCWS